MPLYSQTTLGQFTDYIGQLVDDPDHRYWKAEQIKFATWEGLRLFGALTSYWRTRGSFSLDPTQPDPYYDLSKMLPGLRTRTWTLDTMVKDIQYMLLEPASGISGAGMSGQVTIDGILDAIQYGRDRFVLDAKFPYTVHAKFGVPPPPDGTVAFDQSSVYVHRVSWQDSKTRLWLNLWRQDIWSMDKGNYRWTLEPGQPQAFSEAELSPLILQLYPAPINEGHLDGLTVDSTILNLSDPDTTFDIPDEWIYAIKYAALSNILNSGQILDQLRADYCEKRYQQAVTHCQSAKSVLRLMCNGVPLPMDSLAALDSGNYAWRNQSGPPILCGALFDMVVVYPGQPDQAYGITADVAQTAPIPEQDTDYIQLGVEDLDRLASYVWHNIMFKCGGKDFTDTMDSYDDFMDGVAVRGQIVKNKIINFNATFGQPREDQARNPDRRMINA